MCQLVFKIRALAVLSALLVATLAHASSPALTNILPRGGQRGTDLELTFTGERLGDVKEILFYREGVTVKNLTVAKPQELKVSVTIAPDAKLGEYPLRVRTASGLSELRTFWVGAMPQVEEKEPNTDFAQPQKIELNTTIAGVITDEDVDYFVISAKKGQRITAEVEGMRLGGAMFDPYLAILDKDRFELAVCDDTALLLQDPIVSFIAPRDDQYIIQLRESAYGGSEACRYRLHVGTFPRPRIAYPAGGEAGKELKLELIGDPLGAMSRVVSLPAQSTAAFPLQVDRENAFSPSPAYLRVSPFANVLEAEPNNDAKSATPLPQLPIAANGILATAGDEDQFRFAAKSGQVFDVNVFARQLRSPVDAVLTIVDASGKQIGQNDDTGGPDSYLRFTAPADGDYFVIVRDQLRAGGADFVYRIEIVPVQPKVALSVPVVAPNSQERQTIVVPRGNRFATLIRAARSDFGGDVKLRVEVLPPGVTMSNDPVVDGLDAVPVVFEAAAEAPIGAKLCDVVGEASDPKIKVASEFTQTADLIVFGNQVAYYQVKTPKLAVVVAEEAPFKLKIVQPKVPLVQTGSMQLKVVAERKEGFKAPISLAMRFNPPGVGSGTATIAEGASEATIPLNASGDARLRKWNICVIGMAEHDGPTWVSSPLSKIEIAPPFVTGKIEMASGEQGKPAQMLCNLEQKVAFDGTAKLELFGLPPNATAATKEITAKDSKVVFDVQTDPKTPTGQHNAVFCAITIQKNGEPIVQTVASGGVLRVDAPPAASAAPVVESKAAAAPVSRLEKLRQEQSQKDKAGATP